MYTSYLTLSAEDFANTLKSAALFMVKDSPTSFAQSICLELSESRKELFIMACDGYSFYRRQLTPRENANNIVADLPQIQSEQPDIAPRRLLLLAQKDVNSLLSMLPRKFAYDSLVQFQVTEYEDTSDLNILFSYMSTQTLKFTTTKQSYWESERIQEWVQRGTAAINNIYLGLPQLKRVVSALPKTENIRMTVAEDGKSILFECDAIQTLICVAACYVENNSENSD